MDLMRAFNRIKQDIYKVLKDRGLIPLTNTFVDQKV